MNPTPGSIQHPEFHDWLAHVRGFLAKRVRGQDANLELALATFLARGHLLLEGAPGTGKTSLAKALAQAFGGTFRRLQMTSDLLPSDVVGILRLKPGGSDFEFRKGPIFTNFLLADELNRTSPKTQSALLEAMAEGTTTVDGTTHALPRPFFVVATQNPIEFHGVYPLAESQLDRFMLQLRVLTPEKDAEGEIYRMALQAQKQTEVEESDGPLLTTEQTHRLLHASATVHVDPTLIDYVTELTHATRVHSEIACGVSVRGGLQLLSAAQALALVRGREFVTPQDIKDLTIPALAHRITLADGSADTDRKHNLLGAIVNQVRTPR